MESPKCLCCGREIASGELCSDCERAIIRENDEAAEAAEAEWYAHVMAQYDATRRESGYRPGQE